MDRGAIDRRRTRATVRAVAFGLALAAAAALASVLDGQAFAPYFGALPPWLGAACVSCLATLALLYLRDRGGYGIGFEGDASGAIVRIALFAALFSGIVLAADWGLRFREDLNVPFPASLVFYPVIAVVAETVFHLLPLALLLALSRRLSGREDLAPILFFAPARIEPAFQVRASLAVGFSALDLFVILHVFAFNLAQLHLYRRHGFLAMLSLRLAYYAFWHVGWGHLRLSVLF